MTARARRLPTRLLLRPVRRALLASSLWLANQGAIACSPGSEFPILPGRSSSIEFANSAGLLGRHEKWAAKSETLFLHAGFFQTTDEYGHGILGPVKDAKGLRIIVGRVAGLADTCPREVDLPAYRVFEDIQPRFADLNNDGMPEVLVVESSKSMGARLVAFDRHGRKIAFTTFIGTPYRWLAPIGAADLDGDGHIEVAYIDRPHLAKTLRIWRYRDGRFEHVVDHNGLTNHRIGWDHIPGGMRACGTERPEIITADRDWQRIIASSLENGRITTRDIGPYSGPDSLNQVLNCPAH